NIAPVLHVVADGGEPLVKAGHAHSRRTHVDTAPVLPEIERSADDGKAGSAHLLHSRLSSLYGRRRYSMRGNAIGSRRWSMPQIQVTQRSMPMPNPACGTVPYLRRSRYQSKASFGSLCSSMRRMSKS